MLPPQSPGLLSKPIEIPPHIQCPECSTHFHHSSDFIDYQFNNRNLLCGHCKNRSSAWSIALNMIKKKSMFAYFQPLGAHNTIFETKLFLNTETRIDIYSEGLPKNAVILDINFTPSNMFCVEMTGNNRSQRNRGGRLQLYGFETYTAKGREIFTEGKVNISVVWVEASPDNIAWKNLVSAFNAYANDNFEEAIIPANVAVESKLYRFIKNQLDGISSKDKTKDFLENGATYSHQLNILLPWIVSNSNFRKLDPSIQGLLNNLRSIRNSIAHQGHYLPKLTRERTAELITAALFGFRYLDYLDLELQKEEPDDPND